MRTFEDASYLERFGVELVRYRYHFQLTQDEMAEKCHLTRFVIIGLEKGRSKLDFETLAKLYLECNKYLFFTFIISSEEILPSNLAITSLIIFSIIIYTSILS